MTSFIGRVAVECVATTFATSFTALMGAGFGYVYGKLANLPAGQVAKAYAIWSVAEYALCAVGESFTENKVGKSVIGFTISTLTTAVAITELRKRGLMGDKMMIFTIILQVLSAISCLNEIVKVPNQASTD